MEILEGVRRRFSRRAEAAGRTIELQGVPTEVVADRLRLDQAISSMVDNALRYGSGLVTLRLCVHEGKAEIHVLDQGEGFPDNFVARAFERFSRASSQSDGGSGLGLAIVQTVARAHGGEAHAATAEDGADVWLALPLCSSAPRARSSFRRRPPPGP
jgi:signal transduction histidine kinase